MAGCLWRRLGIRSSIWRATGRSSNSGLGTALSRRAGEDAAAVGARAVACDADARAQFPEVADSFAVGVFNLVRCFSPELVVIGGGISRAGDLLLDPVRKALSECDDLCPASRAEIVPAQGGDDVGLRGGAAYWAESR